MPEAVITNGGSLQVDWVQVKFKGPTTGNPKLTNNSFDPPRVLELLDVTIEDGDSVTVGRGTCKRDSNDENLIHTVRVHGGRPFMSLVVGPNELTLEGAADADLTWQAARLT